MNFESGFEKLEHLFKVNGVSQDSDHYLNLIGFKRQLLRSVEKTEMFAVVSPQEQERQEIILRELDKMAISFCGKGFLDLCLLKGNIHTADVDKISSTAPDPGQRFEPGYALIVGVGNYLHEPFMDLPTTVKDADAIYDILTNSIYCRYLPQNVERLTQKNANLDNFRNSLKKLADKTNLQSTVFIYFSGHGGRLLLGENKNTYLCTRESDPSDLKQTALSGEDFSNYIGSIKSKKMLVVLDACHSSGTMEIKKSVDGIFWKSGLSNEYYEKLNYGSGRVVIASSKEEEYSYILPKYRLSLFTHHLCEALKGNASIRNDGLVRVLDVFHYVNEAVHSDEPRQTPILKVKESDNNFPIALAPHKV